MWTGQIFYSEDLKMQGMVKYILIMDWYRVYYNNLN